MTGVRTDDALAKANGDGPVGADELAAIRLKIQQWNSRASKFFDRRRAG